MCDLFIIPRAATRWAAAAVPLLVARRAPPAKRASSAGSSVCGYDSETPHEIQNEALYRACRAYGLGERFLAAAQDEGTFGEWLDELPFEVAAATARLLKHHARSGRRVGRDHPRQP